MIYSVLSGLCLAYVAYAKCTDKFACVSETAFEAYGIQYNCAPNMYCNKKCQPTGNEILACVTDITAYCDFTCKNNIWVVDSNGLERPCETGKRCNPVEGRRTCDTCIEDCGEKFFECHATNSSIVKIGGREGVCPTGTVCNKQFLPPCSEPCI